MYCWCAREISEEDLDPATMPEMRLDQWKGSRLGALPVDGMSTKNATVMPVDESCWIVLQHLCDTLKRAQFPIIVTTYAGRNREIPGLLGKLAGQLSIPVFSSCPSNVNISFDHPMHAGVSYTGKNLYVEAADWILVLDSDVPW